MLEECHCSLAVVLLLSHEELTKTMTSLLPRKKGTQTIVTPINLNKKGHSHTRFCGTHRLNACVVLLCGVDGNDENIILLSTYFVAGRVFDAFHTVHYFI